MIENLSWSACTCTDIEQVDVVPSNKPGASYVCKLSYTKSIAFS